MDTAQEPNATGPRHSTDSPTSSLVTGIFLFEDGSMMLGPSAGVRVSPAWPLARVPSRRFSILVAQSGIELRVRLEVQGKNVSTKWYHTSC